MRERLPYIIALASGVILAGWFVRVLMKRPPAEWPAPPPVVSRTVAPAPAVPAAAVEKPAAPPAGDDEEEFAEADATPRLKAMLQKRLESKDALPHEAVLTFKTEEAYRKFLARAGKAGLRLSGQIDALRTVRVGFDSIDALFDDMAGNTADYDNVGANFFVRVPEVPPPEDRARVNQVAFGNTMLSFLGVPPDHAEWGRGITIAILDSGVADDATFGQGRLTRLDIGHGLAPGTGQEDGHGTAVASLAGGALADAPGVAPAANLLSIRVTGADGTSDSFSLAQGLMAAVDAGARIVNISLGAYFDAGVVANAIDYASAHGVVVVASAGNDGAGQLTWPAADPRVVSVGAVDALEQQVYFSNGGAQLKLTAPGYGVQTAWLNGQRVSFDGTSASAPIVAGAIAAMMSTNPGMTGLQAWQTLQQFASDGGTPGTDPNYGAGIVNLGWAMNHNDVTRVDAAIAGEYYDPSTGLMNFVVQNRGGQAATGLEFAFSIGGAATNYSLPQLNPGASFLIQAPVDQAQLAQNGRLVFRTQLNPPGEVVDQVPANNSKAGVIYPPQTVKK